MKKVRQLAAAAAFCLAASMTTYATPPNPCRQISAEPFAMAQFTIASVLSALVGMPGL